MNSTFAVITPLICSARVSISSCSLVQVFSIEPWWNLIWVWNLNSQKSQKNFNQFWFSLSFNLRYSHYFRLHCIHQGSNHTLAFRGIQLHHHPFWVLVVGRIDWKYRELLSILFFYDIQTKSSQKPPAGFQPSSSLSTLLTVQIDYLQ